MSAVSRKSTPASRAASTTARVPSRSTRRPKLLQPSPTTETSIPLAPSVRRSMIRSYAAGYPRGVRYFYGCGHEQFRPSALLRHAVLAEEAGFDGITCSDHLQPWWEPGESGNAWMWLGAAAQATERVPVGPAVTVALQRYHPVLVAQGFATLEAMFPGRVFVGIGSGESLNESPLGLDWPRPADQLAALDEACGLVRR